ncbi:MAG TPA: substrate-binding domain-containing protein [Polyangiaceae bacterium]|jgi:ABC-type xylose transport system substrate-binding protein|nr:substrate-binding domain-containing protein [Polyangiaceae bacterium]
MKRSFSLLSLLLTAALVVFGCNKKSDAPEPGPAAKSEGLPKVSFLLSTLQEERYKKDQRYFEETARAQGLSPFTLSADNDNARQLSQVEDALSRGAKVLVIQPTDSAAAAGYVQKAHDKGAKVVAYDRAIPGADFYVAHDSYRVGVLQAEQAIKATGGKGNFVILAGQSGHSVASEISRGYRETLKPYLDKGAITIVLEKSHDAWSPEQALKTVEDAISKKQGNIQAILAHNSGMARGAVQAVQAAGLGDKGIFIAGADADAANVNYVCEKKQSVEVLKDIKPLAEKAAVVAGHLAKGEAVEAEQKLNGVPVVAVPVVLVTADNVKATLIDSGFHTAEAVHSCK